ncbi:MAG: hypothetical protein UY35_C0005G0078 [Candidatus Saccharibacteria bacterium GW2011_GWC2_48_9]|nr:MAG: hypothetical protein UY35_C0005G0078 [Candidatus Saccharibacteria bacterium GW2011_GWC2_48_9]
MVRHSAADCDISSTPTSIVIMSIGAYVRAWLSVLSLLLQAVDVYYDILLHMKSKYVAIIATGFLLIATGLMVVIPIQTNADDCGLGERFSLARGQYEEFKKAEDISNNSFSMSNGACPAYNHDYVKNRLYIL